MSTRKALARAAAVLAVLVALTVAAVSGAPAAFASFASSHGAVLAVSSGTVAPPTGVSASVSCLLTHKLTVHWTAPSGSAATGYAVFKTTNGGSAMLVQTVSGTTTSISFAISIWTTYTVLVQTDHNSWVSILSAPSNGVSCLL